MKIKLENDDLHLLGFGIMAVVTAAITVGLILLANSLA